MTATVLPEAGIRPADDTRYAPFDSFRGVSIAVMLIGVVLRAHAFVDRYDLYLDEELTALNILGRSLAALWQPLDLGQSAPPLFLVATKTVSLVAGAGPLALRLIPFLAGCALLPMFWWASRLVLRPGEALLALAMLALSPEAIFYSNYLKPYSSDAFVTIALLLLTVPLLDRRAGARPSARHLLALAVAGAVGVLASSTAIFVLAGVATALLVRFLRQPPRTRAAVAVLAACGVWAGLTALLLNSTYSALADPASPTSIYMRDFWRPFFVLNSLNGPHNSIRMALASLLDSAFLWSPFGEHGSAHTLLFAGLLGAGMLAATVRRLDIGLLLGVPIVALFAASALGRYPMGPRLTLFLAPVSAVGIAAAAGLVLRRLPQRPRAFVLAGLIGVRAFAEAPLLVYPLDPTLGTGAPAFLAVIDRDLGTPVYCRPGFVPDWLYHLSDWRHPDTVAVRRLIRDVDLDGPAPLFTRMPRLLGRTDPSRDGPPDEQWHGRAFLVGRFSGYGDGHRTTDVAWANADAGRIEAAGPCTWLLLNARAVGENHDLVRALHQRGVMISDFRRELTYETFRVCFDAAPGDRRAGPRRPGNSR